MISATEASNILQSFPLPFKTQCIPLRQSVGSTCAADMVSPVDMPPFHNSAMDGYAFAFADWQQGKPLRIEGELQAGAGNLPLHKPGTAVRIFTGAVVPEWADTVVMQEKTSCEGEWLYVLDENLKCGGNVRLKGSQTLVGQTILRKGTRMTPGIVGFLASLGIAELEVVCTPKVAVVVTGNEIVQPGENLQPGRIYDCNSYSLAAALQVLGLQCSIYHAIDQRDELKTTLKTALEECDLLLVTGGVSVGDYDLVVPVLNELGVDTRFHKIKQKPAKPLFFGTKGEQRIFGLPGNPGSVLTGWYAWVQPYLWQSWGTRTEFLRQRATIMNELKHKPGLTLFAKGLLRGNRVEILKGQESYRLDAFVEANCFVVLPDDSEGANAGDEVEVILFNPC